MWALFLNHCKRERFPSIQWEIFGSWSHLREPLPQPLFVGKSIWFYFPKSINLWYSILLLAEFFGSFLNKLNLFLPIYSTPAVRFLDRKISEQYTLVFWAKVFVWRFCIHLFFCESLNQSSYHLFFFFTESSGQDLFSNFLVCMCLNQFQLLWFLRKF